MHAGSEVFSRFAAFIINGLLFSMIASTMIFLCGDKENVSITISVAILVAYLFLVLLSVYFKRHLICQWLNKQLFQCRQHHVTANHSDSSQDNSLQQENKSPICNEAFLQPIFLPNSFSFQKGIEATDLVLDNETKDQGGPSFDTPKFKDKAVRSNIQQQEADPLAVRKRKLLSNKFGVSLDIDPNYMERESDEQSECFGDTMKEDIVKIQGSVVKYQRVKSPGLAFKRPPKRASSIDLNNIMRTEFTQGEELKFCKTQGDKAFSPKKLELMDYHNFTYPRHKIHRDLHDQIAAVMYGNFQTSNDEKPSEFLNTGNLMEENNINSGIDQGIEVDIQSLLIFRPLNRSKNVQPGANIQATTVAENEGDCIISIASD
ncbi:hypothetical protein FGO68_gene15195 [Halteria grandinella]|uniref:Uncharacterized protein n=1 Tax=Halteria grandinella TaxID=5974 RepID=A0A8J8P0P3_HALGN|nr:hypothetical protein FGO68_gene15195 [Halteria grandinella]